MELIQTEHGITVQGQSYRIFMERAGGFAIRELEVAGQGRLDRFDRPGEGPHPTCMYFDNITVNDTFQLAHYGKANTSVEAVIDGSTVELQGHLVAIASDTKGCVAIRKVMRFSEDLYDVDVHLVFEDTGAIEYTSVWWDVNDKWLRAMRSSAGVFMPLRVGIGDAFADNLNLTWRSMAAMDRGAGMWMELLGEHASVMTVLRSPPAASFKAGGMKYWDGPDDIDEGEGVSHGCINLDLVNCELSGVQPQIIEELHVAYRVFLSGPTVLRDVDT